MVRHGDRRAGLYLTEMGWGSAYDPRAVAFEVGLHGQARELRAAYALPARQPRPAAAAAGRLVHLEGRCPGACNFCDSSGLFRQGERFRPKPAWRTPSCSSIRRW